MVNQVTKISTFLILLGIFSSCTEVIDIELDSTYKRLVVYGTITTDSVHHTVQLTSTTDYFFNEAPPVVSGASVSVSYENQNIDLIESAEYPGTYFTPEAFRGKLGETYSLYVSEVDIDDDGVFEDYEATARMPDLLPPDSIVLQKFITPFFSGYQVALWSPEPEGRNWYNFKLFRNGEPINKRLSDYSVQPDDFVNDGYTSGLPIGFLDDDDEDEFILPGDTVMLEVNSISEQFYNFITQAQSEIFGNNPLFSGPPANVSTNLNNNAQGIFTAYAIGRIYTIAGFPPGLQ